MSKLNRQRGFSIIELMVAMVLSIFLVGGMTQVYLANKKTYRFNEALSRVQESGRFALDMIARDVRMAAFYGCLRDLDEITSSLDESHKDYDPNAHDFKNNDGIEGSDNSGLNGSDTLELRGAFGAGLELKGKMQNGSAHIGVEKNGGLQQGDIVILTDCVQGDVLQVSNANPDSGSLVHNTGNPKPQGPGNKTKTLSKGYDEGAIVLRMRSVGYSVKTGASGEPALFRRDGAVDQEMVEGIENLQVLYGEDTDADGRADRYVPAGTVGDMEDVMSLRISVLVRSPENNVTDAAQQFTYNGAAVTAGDMRLRQVFTTTVTIRNRVL